MQLFGVIHALTHRVKGANIESQKSEKELIRLRTVVSMTRLAHGRAVMVLPKLPELTRGID